MKVLVVCSGNAKEISPFVSEQCEALAGYGVDISYFLIRGKGVSGYLRNLPAFLKAVAKHKPALVHAHYSLCGVIAVLQRKVPVVVTYHGSDVNTPSLLLLSRFPMWLASANIFVSEPMRRRANPGNATVIPCGVNLDTFKPLDRAECRQKMNLKPEGRYILFSSAFDNPEKNYQLAKSAMLMLTDKSVELLELKGYKRHEVALLMNAVNVALLTSPAEGSPQFVKEALACNLPVVSTDVGDVRALMEGVEGCHITGFEPAEVAEKIQTVILSDKRISGREKILHFDNKSIAKRVFDVYQQILN